MKTKTNTFLEKLKKDFSNILSMLSEPSISSDLSLDSYVPTSGEDAAIIEELKASERNIGDNANMFFNSIGSKRNNNKSQNTSRRLNNPTISVEHTRRYNKEIER